VRLEGGWVTRVGGPFLAGIALAAAAAGGCVRTSGMLWADTATPTGGFSRLARQSAYDGEPVTFEMECAPGVNYVVFGVEGNETVVEVPTSLGRYRDVRTFRAGDKPVTYEVYATPFVIRGVRDWYYDSAEKAWYFHPRSGDRTDVQAGPEETIRIVCYRREVRVPIKGRGGPPKAIDLRLTAASGEVTRVPWRRPADGPDARGFLLLGPDKKGLYEVTYQPTYKEVSRSGTTLVEALVTHADGTLEQVRQDLDTP